MGNGSYNSLIGQIAFCKMQSFDTKSRSTSGSVPMFMDGRISFGVGLSDINMREVPYFRCGECLQITQMKPFYPWNLELTAWTEHPIPVRPFTVMVFDQCTDPICTRDYLDFDIYNPLQPVSHGNPQGITWTSIPCPVQHGETIEYLFCTSQSCHVQDPSDNTTLRKLASPSLTLYYWSITIRNTRLPIKSVIIQYQGQYFSLRLENAWIWDLGPFFLDEDVVLWMEDSQGLSTEDTISFSTLLDQATTPGYHGGLLIRSGVQN